MLQFWKKSGHCENNKQCPPETTNKHISQDSLQNYASRPDSAPLASFKDEDVFNHNEIDAPREGSKLVNNTLKDILYDKGSLSYFVQYMESRNASCYISCWLDLESFKTDLQQKEASSSLKFVPISLKVDHDSLSLSTDCDSITADSSSLCDFSDRVTHVSETSGFCDRDTSDTSPRCEDSEQPCGPDVADNALKIFKKYIALEAVQNIQCSDQVRTEIIENICNPDKLLDSGCFDKVQSFVFETMEKEFFEAFLGSDYFCKHQIDVLTSGNVALEDILYNETALFYFMEYLEQENSRSLLEFWIAATNLQQQLHDQKEFYDPIEAQNDAVVLYDKYFSLQAHCPLGFSDKIRFEVEQSICGENGLDINCFQLPLKVVKYFLEKNYLRPFLASQLYYKYLSELINTVQSNGYSLNLENNKHSPSDCSSERSFSTNSTFLALEINHNMKQKTRNKSDMSIDTRQLCDPDSLWKRKKKRLICGRVTSLGKFETDLQPEPDRKQFQLKNVVKKFVNLEEEERKKEEMAWQVAEMIVKDITSVTLSQQQNS